MSYKALKILGSAGYLK